MYLVNIYNEQSAFNDHNLYSSLRETSQFFSLILQLKIIQNTTKAYWVIVHCCITYYNEQQDTIQTVGNGKLNKGYFISLIIQCSDIIVRFIQRHRQRGQILCFELEHTKAVSQKSLASHFTCMSFMQTFLSVLDYPQHVHQEVRT